jgi:hypothetical protein
MLKRMINKLCESFETRVAIMKEAGGETIQPLLSSNATAVPAGHLPDRQHIVALAPWPGTMTNISDANQLKNCG